MRNHYSFKKQVCRACGRKVMVHAFKHNVTKGWWSIYAVFLNPILLVLNLCMYALFCRRITAVSQASPHR